METISALRGPIAGGRSVGGFGHQISWSPLHCGRIHIARQRNFGRQSIFCTNGVERRTNGKLQQRRLCIVFATSEEEPVTSVEEVKDVAQLEDEIEASKAELNKALNELKKVQASNKGAYEESAEKAIEVLRDTTEQLREQAERARAALTATALETAELSKSNLSHLAENGPDPIKDIAETALQAHYAEKSSKGAKIHDFCLGIPYGGLLVLGGLLWFIISGSGEAIRFGVLLGSILLALSVASLKVWKQGKSSIPYIKGQAVITLIIFIKEFRRYLATGSFFPPLVASFASGSMLAFYAYVYVAGGNPPKKVKEVGSTT